MKTILILCDHWFSVCKLFVWVCLLYDINVTIDTHLDCKLLVLVCLCYEQRPFYINVTFDTQLDCKFLEWVCLCCEQKVREYDQEIVHNHTLQTNPRHHEEEPQSIYSNKTSDENKSKATSSLFLV